MSFKLFEISSRLGRPVSLYEFTWGNTIWRYTNADKDIEWGVDELDNPLVWEAIPISDEGYVQGPQSDPLAVTLPVRLELCQLFRSTPPSTSIWMKVRRFHKDDPDQEMTVYWVGMVGNIKRKNLVTAEVVGLPISNTMRRTGLRLCWERNCPHALYDVNCRVNKEDFKTVAEITDLSGTTITVDTLGIYTGQQYMGGFIEWEANADGTIDRRGIQGFSGGTTLAMFGTTDRLEVGMTISMYLGCDLTASTCSGTFGNLPNHGGMAFLPGESPFDGRQLFY
jgi:uncharacterized phage protein (TIGR02218 family)